MIRRLSESMKLALMMYQLVKNKSILAWYPLRLFETGHRVGWVQQAVFDPGQIR
jgi:hypothetical protein